MQRDTFHEGYDRAPDRRVDDAGKRPRKPHRIGLSKERKRRAGQSPLEFQKRNGAWRKSPQRNARIRRNRRTGRRVPDERE